MIYNNYRIKFYKNSSNGKKPVKEYIENLNWKDRSKVLKYIDFLRERGGYLDEPYSKHITGKMRELRVDFGRNRHRIFYFTFIGKAIILLSAFNKKSAKTPAGEIEKALNNYQDAINNPKMYE